MNLCISLVYIHIAIWCMVHTTSNWEWYYSVWLLDHFIWQFWVGFILYYHRYLTYWDPFSVTLSDNPEVFNLSNQPYIHWNVNTEPWSSFILLSCRPCQMKPMNCFQSSIRHLANSIVLQFQQLTGAMRAPLWGSATWLPLALGNRHWCKTRRCMHSANPIAASWFWC